MNPQKFSERREDCLQDKQTSTLQITIGVLNENMLKKGEKEREREFIQNSQTSFIKIIILMCSPPCGWSRIEIEMKCMSEGGKKLN